MSKSFIKKTCLVLAVIAVFAAFIALSGAFMPASAVTVEDTGIKESYSYGETLEITEAELSYNGETQKVFPVLELPDGTAVKKSSIVLNSTGRYRLIYSAKFGAVPMRAIKEFTVYSITSEVTGEGSSLEFVELECGDNAGNPWYMSKKVGDEYIFTDLTGLKASTISGGEFKYNKIISLKELNGAPFVTLDMLPQIEGEYDVGDLFIKLTDAHDPSNYVTIKMNKSYDTGASEHWSYIKAGAFHQPIKGWLDGVGGAGDRFHPSERAGTALEYSFMGKNLGAKDLGFT